MENKDTTLAQKADTLKKNLNTKNTSDSTRIRIGNKSITIIDDNDHTTFTFPNHNRKHYDSWDIEYKRKSGFTGHWAGLEFGVNGLMDKNQSLTLKGDLAPLDLKQARSWNIKPKLYAV